MFHNFLGSSLGHIFKIEDTSFEIFHNNAVLKLPLVIMHSMHSIVIS